MSCKMAHSLNTQRHSPNKNNKCRETAYIKKIHIRGMRMINIALYSQAKFLSLIFHQPAILVLEQLPRTTEYGAFFNHVPGCAPNLISEGRKLI